MKIRLLLADLVASTEHAALSTGQPRVLEMLASEHSDVPCASKLAISFAVDFAFAGGRQPQGALASLPLELVLAVELLLPPIASEGNRPSKIFARGSACYKQFGQTTDLSC